MRLLACGRRLLRRPRLPARRRGTSSGARTPAGAGAAPEQGRPTAHAQMARVGEAWASEKPAAPRRVRQDGREGVDDLRRGHDDGEGSSGPRGWPGAATSGASPSAAEAGAARSRWAAAAARTPSPPQTPDTRDGVETSRCIHARIYFLRNLRSAMSEPRGVERPTSATARCTVVGGSDGAARPRRSTTPSTRFASSSAAGGAAMAAPALRPAASATPARPSAAAERRPG